MTESPVWFIRRRGRVEGPWDLCKLRSEVSLRRLARYDELSVDGTNWRQAGDLPDLFPPTPSIAERFPLQRVAPTASPSVEDLEPERPSVEDALPGMETPRTPLGEAIWYWDRNGEADGPHPIETILDLVVQRRLTLDDLVWRDGFDEWQAIGQTEETLARLPVPTNSAPARSGVETESRPPRGGRSSSRERPRSYALGAWSLILAGVLLVPSLAPGCGILGAIPFVVSCIALYESRLRRRGGVEFAIGALVLSSLEVLAGLAWFAYFYGAASSAWDWPDH